MSVSFPSSPRPRITANSSSLSLVHATSVEVCNGVYGQSVSSSQDTLERFYEPNAGMIYSPRPALIADTDINSNPFITASSRSLIADMFRLSQQFHRIDVRAPGRALAMLYTLFRIQPSSDTRARNSLFSALQVWHDLEDVCESESFDGHRKSIIEHTLNVLVLPGIHIDRGRPLHPSSDSLLSTSTSQSHPISPALPILGTSFSVPSPLHLQLHVITRLSFNEQGRITHHRDFWDVKDLMGLVPGVSVAQWIGTRLAATGLSCLLRLCTGVGPAQQTKHGHQEQNIELRSESPTSAESDEDADAAAGLSYLSTDHLTISNFSIIEHPHS